MTFFHKVRTLLGKRSATAVIAVAIGIATSTSYANVPGVSDTTIKIGILGSLSGPFAFFGTGNLAGATLAFEEVNAAGGINGRKLEWVSLDDESSPPKGIAAYKRLVESEGVFAVFGPAASAVGQAMVPTLRQSSTPTFISIFSTPAVTEPVIQNVFRTGPMNDREQGHAIANYVVENLDAKKIALIRQSDEYGKRGADSVKERLETLSFPAHIEEVFNINDTDFSAQLSKIVASDPDVLVVYGYPNPSAIITRQARQLGLKGIIMGSNSAGSRKYPEIVGTAAAGTQNILTLDILPESTATPEAEAFRTAFVERFPDLARQDRPDLGDTLGYGGALTFIEGLRRAGQDLTQEGFVEVLENMKDFKTGITLPTTFSKNNHEGNSSARIVVIKEDLTREMLPTVVSVEREQ